MNDNVDKRENQNELEELSANELNVVFGGISPNDFTGCELLRDEENPYDGRKKRPNE